MELQIYAVIVQDCSGTIDDYIDPGISCSRAYRHRIRNIRDGMRCCLCKYEEIFFTRYTSTLEAAAKHLKAHRDGLQRR